MINPAFADKSEGARVELRDVHDAQPWVWTPLHDDDDDDDDDDNDEDDVDVDVDVDGDALGFLSSHNSHVAHASVRLSHT